jgi:pimeloyl-ACP methyl ester carboxylesterase
VTSSQIDVIFLPGLGADERLFNLIDTGPCRKHFIRWHQPKDSDTFANYVIHIKKQVEHLDRPVLIGVSLGGMVAMELRELMPVRKSILVSSVKSRNDMPGYIDWVRAFHFNEWIPPSVMKFTAPFMKPFLCGPSDEKTYELFKAMLHDADESFIRWSLRQVMQWPRTSFVPGNIIHIHGTDDVVFPIDNIQDCNYRIPGGAHDMILSKPKEISEILSREIAEYEAY